MDKNRIDFIICCNDLKYLDECRYYINRLIVPDRFKIGIIPVFNAYSMTSGYNKGMKSSDAKYKIYMHQDVFCVHKDLLVDLLDIFQEESIGMIGMVGSSALPENAAFLLEWDIVNIYTCNGSSSIQLFQGVEEADKYRDVDMIDGMFMATQYDFEWDEQNFDGWHFYDASHSMRIRENYRIVVPAEKTYIMHDAGPCSYEEWDVYRKIFCNLYQDFTCTPVVLPNYKEVREKRDKIKKLIKENQINLAISEINSIHKVDDPEIVYMVIFLEYYVRNYNATGEYIKYDKDRFIFICDKLRFLFFRKEFINSEAAVHDMETFISNENISKDIIEIVKNHYEIQYSSNNNYNQLLVKIQNALYEGEFIVAEQTLRSVKKYNSKLAMVYRIFEIFKMEVKSDCLYTVFDYSLDVYELERHFMQVKLMLRRLEYDVAEETWTQIYQYIVKNQVSGCFLTSIISTDMFDKKNATKNLLELLRKYDIDNSERIKTLSIFYDNIWYMEYQGRK